MSDAVREAGPMERWMDVMWCGVSLCDDRLLRTVADGSARCIPTFVQPSLVDIEIDRLTDQWRVCNSIDRLALSFRIGLS